MNRTLLTALLCAIIQLVFAQERTGPLRRTNAIELDFSVQGGFYPKGFEVELHTEPGAKVYYTLDGTLPTRRSKVYKAPIRIKSSTVLRAVARKGRRKSQHRTHSYFIGEPATDFPNISIAIPPNVLFDPERGLFMKGEDAIDSIWSLPGANFWSRSEKLVNVEFFEPNGVCYYNNLSGFRLFGGMSRLFPQKSMTLVARKRYGEKRFRHRVFGKEGEKDFKFLVLRNSGSDWGKAHFRDAFMTRLLDKWDIEKQDYRPAHVYINSKYWGIYNIREKINRYFLEDHEGIDKDSLELMEHRFNRKRGSRQKYRELLQYLKENDLSDPSKYAYLHSLMDVDNFMQYQIAQIYFDNQDAGGNIKYWRPGTVDGRWRWIIYDTDWGFGLHDETAYKNNSLAFHLEEKGPAWPNPPWSTFILRKLMENENFRKEFVNRFLDHINTTFDSERAVKIINDFYTQLQPEMPRHLDRWNLSDRVWNDQVRLMKVFAVERPAYMRHHLQKMFRAGDLVRVKATAEGGGSIHINQDVKVTGSFEGKYFSRLPIRVKAVPNFGFRFSHWEGVDISKEERAFALRLRKSSYHIRAVFVRSVHPLAGKVLLNEVSANNRQCRDWVEIINTSDQVVNMKDWIFTDSKNEYLIPEVTIRPNDYLILAENVRKFRRTFPNVPNVVGGFGFGLNKRREVLSLYTNTGAAVDSTAYEIEPTDSLFTLGLLLPSLDNSDEENWEQNFGPGTPSRANPYYLESRIKAKQERAMMIGGVAGMLLVFIFLLMTKGRKS
ncbi:MAG: CotH kinase family protein [Bacteroidota bacterium]